MDKWYTAYSLLGGEVAQRGGRESDQINSTWQHFHLLSDLWFLKKKKKKKKTWCVKGY
jgi:hypothetical protein